MYEEDIPREEAKFIENFHIMTGVLNIGRIPLKYIHSHQFEYAIIVNGITLQGKPFEVA